jgi:deoxycytidylate deaminase
MERKAWLDHAKKCFNIYRSAPLAQLDRACGYGPQGWGFKSLRAHQKAFPAVKSRFFYSKPEMNQDHKFMRAAVSQAKKALAKGDIPVGCVIVQEGKIIARGHNLREVKNDPTAHAEIVALKKAGKKLGADRCIGLCHLRAVSDVCGRARAGAGETRGLRVQGLEGGRPRQPL